MKSYIVWDITQCSTLEVNRCFWGTCRLHLQGWRVSKPRNQCEAGSKKQVALLVERFTENYTPYTFPTFRISFFIISYFFKTLLLFSDLLIRDMRNYNDVSKLEWHVMNAKGHDLNKVSVCVLVLKSQDWFSMDKIQMHCRVSLCGLCFIIWFRDWFNYTYYLFWDMLGDDKLCTNSGTSQTLIKLPYILRKSFKRRNYINGYGLVLGQRSEWNFLQI
jgi:hypothetical protein